VRVLQTVCGPRTVCGTREAHSGRPPAPTARQKTPHHSEGALEQEWPLELGAFAFALA